MESFWVVWAGGGLGLATFFYNSGERPYSPTYILRTPDRRERN